MVGSPREEPAEMGPEVYVRRMTVDDIPAIMEIERRSFPTPWSEGAFRSEITQNACADYIVAAAGDRVLGYAGMWLFLFESHVTNIAVDPDHRGRKIGARLLLSLMARALARGLNRMSLEVRVSNALARSFYECYGFEFVRIRRGYYTDTGEDAAVMLCRDTRPMLRGER